MKVGCNVSKLLKAISFDDSDRQVFNSTAEQNGWLVSCAFQFCDMQWAEMDGKTRQTFNNGFLGPVSLGYSTFGCVANITASALTDVEMILARYLYEKFGAPNLQSALDAARQETDYIANLCMDVPENTIFAVKREFALDGKIRESFHKVDMSDQDRLHAKIWTIADDD